MHYGKLIFTEAHSGHGFLLLFWSISTMYRLLLAINLLILIIHVYRFLSSIPVHITIQYISFIFQYYKKKNGIYWLMFGIYRLSQFSIYQRLICIYFCQNFLHGMNSVSIVHMYNIDNNRNSPEMNVIGMKQSIQ